MSYKNKSLCTYDVASFPGFFDIPLLLLRVHAAAAVVRSSAHSNDRVCRRNAFVRRRTRPNIASYFSYVLMVGKKIYIILFTVCNIYFHLFRLTCLYVRTRLFDVFAVWSGHTGKSLWSYRRIATNTANWQKKKCKIKISFWYANITLFFTRNIIA